MDAKITPSEVQQLTTDQILVASVGKDNKRDPKQIIAMYRMELANPDAVKLREGNTIFIVHKSKKPGFGVLRILNADSAYNYARNITAWLKAITKSGFDTIVVDFKDRQLVNLFKYVEKNPPVPGLSYEMQVLPSGGYRAIIKFAQVGDKNV